MLRIVNSVFWNNPGHRNLLLRLTLKDFSLFLFSIFTDTVMSSTPWHTGIPFIHFLTIHVLMPFNGAFWTLITNWKTPITTIQKNFITHVLDWNFSMTFLTVFPIILSFKLSPWMIQTSPFLALMVRLIKTFKMVSKPLKYQISHPKETANGSRLGLV